MRASVARRIYALKAHGDRKDRGVARNVLNKPRVPDPYPAAVVVYLDVFSMDELSMPGCRSLDRIPSLAPNDIPGVSLRPGFLPSGDRPGSFNGTFLRLASEKEVSEPYELVPGDLVLFRGRRSAHRVAPLGRDGGRRVVALLSYADEPDFYWRHLKPDKDGARSRSKTTSQGAAGATDDAGGADVETGVAESSSGDDSEKDDLYS